MKVNCKTCGCLIYHDYSPIESLNCHSSEKYLSELTQFPTDTCHTNIYLTCEKNHTNVYYCNVETNEKPRDKTQINGLLVLYRGLYSKITNIFRDQKK